MSNSPAKQNNKPDLPDFFARLAIFFRPDLSEYEGDAQVNRINDVLGTLSTLLPAIIGVIWLIKISTWVSLIEQWYVIIPIGVLLALLNHWQFFLVTDMEVRGGGWYGNVNSSLDSILRWSAVFIFGPTVLWVIIFVETIMVFFRGANIPWSNRKDRMWFYFQNISLQFAVLILLPLIVFSAYSAWGGTFPIAGLSIQAFAIGAAALGFQFLLEQVFLWITYLGYKLGYTLWRSRETVTRTMLMSMIRLYLLGTIIPVVGSLFSPILAGIYVEHGIFLYLGFSLAVAFMAWLANRMSQAMENSRGQTVQIGKLEALGRAILNSPPDNSQLPDLLTEHAAGMFAYVHFAIWLDYDQTLLKLPKRWEAKELEQIKSWLVDYGKACTLNSKEKQPWSGQTDTNKHYPTIITPIFDEESGQAIGGIYLELTNFGQTQNKNFLKNTLPTVQSLAAQIASAIHQAQVHQQLIAHQKTQNELEFARRIQTDFLPSSLPAIPGWQISASLKPAREMSGDFYDVITLPHGKFGLLIADVADKGVGPALYMALSRTVIRTFATQFKDQPAQVLNASNQRIIEDAGDNMFVTTFYGVFDPKSGTFMYANAGHNPPLLIRKNQPEAQELLIRTGTALGIMEDLTWEPKQVTLGEGDVLVFYTDGVTEAQNRENIVFGDERLLNCVRENTAGTAEEIHHAILESIQNFVGDAPQFDDITLIVLKRS